MGALDKLSKRMESEARDKGAVKTKKTASASPGKSASVAGTKKAATKPAAVKGKTEDRVIKPEVIKTEDVKDTANVYSTSSPVNPPVEEASAKKLGRPVVRGEKNKDYRMVNLAVPIAMYDELKALAGGNVTYFINSILREALEERKR